jgi:hypothetical protein
MDLFSSLRKEVISVDTKMSIVEQYDSICDRVFTSFSTSTSSYGDRRLGEPECIQLNEIIHKFLIKNEERVVHHLRVIGLVETANDCGGPCKYLKPRNDYVYVFTDKGKLYKFIITYSRENGRPCEGTYQISEPKLLSETPHIVDLPILKNIFRSVWKVKNHNAPIGNPERMGCINAMVCVGMEIDDDKLLNRALLTAEDIHEQNMISYLNMIECCYQTQTNTLNDGKYVSSRMNPLPKTPDQMKVKLKKQ